MDLQIEELNPDVVGKKLGQKLFSPKGGLLLVMGAEIKQIHFRYFRDIGYRSVYVINEQGEATEAAGHLISDKLRATSPMTLKNIYMRLQSKDKSLVARGKKELSVLADDIINGVNVKITQPPDILDLKREEDYLYQHAINVAAYSVLIGQSLQYHQLKLFDLTLSALLANFGMQFIDSKILLKQGELDEDEFNEVKKHTILGFQHLSRKCNMKGLVSSVAVQHHERHDGSGYMKGMIGEEIHEYSRIVALTDFFDAYTSDRPHRRLNVIDEAVDYVKANIGRDFDPRIAEHFLRFFEL